MLTLYVETGCPYCKRVLDAFHHTTASYNVRNIADAENLAQLLEYGGLHQAPFLYSKEENVNLYESEKIVDYLHTRFGIDG